MILISVSMADSKLKSGSLIYLKTTYIKEYYDFKVWIESDVKAVPQSYLGPKTGTWIEI